MIHTKPKKFPYFPQIGDELVYIPYGHRLYLQAVQMLNLYHHYTIKQAKEDSDVIYCRVKRIEFEKHVNVRYTKLSLALIDASSEREMSQKMTVRFHDIDNVLDFLILRQTYDRSLNNNWKPGDYFRAIVEDKWWFGNIQGWNITDNNMSTQFQGLNIIWANGVTEQLSFWDLERIQGLLPPNKNQSIDVTDEDRHRFYESSQDEWPSCGKAEECQRIIKGLEQVIQLKEYKQLIQILNRQNVAYMEVIAYPIDLDIVCERTRNLFYRRQAAIKYDIKFLWRNASAFESKYPNTNVIDNALMVMSVCFKFIDDHKATDIDLIYKSIDKHNLQKMKYYSCVRKHINPMASNLVPENNNLFIPSTSNPIQNIVIDSSEPPLIELSDSDDNSDEQVSSEDRVQQIVSSMESEVISPTAPNSPPESERTPTMTSPQIGATDTRERAESVLRPTQPVQPIVQQSEDIQNQVCFECRDRSHSTHRSFFRFRAVHLKHISVFFVIHFSHRKNKLLITTWRMSSK